MRTNPNAPPQGNLHERTSTSKVLAHKVCEAILKYSFVSIVVSAEVHCGSPQQDTPFGDARAGAPVDSEPFRAKDVTTDTESLETTSFGEDMLPGVKSELTNIGKTLGTKTRKRSRCHRTQFPALLVYTVGTKCRTSTKGKPTLLDTSCCLRTMRASCTPTTTPRLQVGWHLAGCAQPADLR